MKKLTKEEKIDHINRCEFHKGRKEGICPTVSIEEANKLRKEDEKNKKQNGKTK